MNETVGFDIREKDRKRKSVWARNFLAYKLKQMGLSLNVIGDIIERDHSTVVHALKSAKNALEYPLLYQDSIEIWNSFQEKLNLEQI